MSFEESSFEINKDETGCLCGRLLFGIQGFLFRATEGQRQGLEGLGRPARGWFPESLDFCAWKKMK